MGRLWLVGGCSFPEPPALMMWPLEWGEEEEEEETAAGLSNDCLFLETSVDWWESEEVSETEWGD